MEDYKRDLIYGILTEQKEEKYTRAELMEKYIEELEEIYDSLEG